MNKRQFSDSGFTVVADTNALATGKYSGIQVLEDAVIASIAFEPGYNGDTDIQTLTIVGSVETRPDCLYQDKVYLV